MREGPAAHGGYFENTLLSPPLSGEKLCIFGDIAKENFIGNEYNKFRIGKED